MRLLLLSALAALALGACTQAPDDDHTATDDDANITGRKPAGAACSSSGECAIGAKYCEKNQTGERVCQAKVDTGYGVCGKSENELGIGRACVDHRCSGSASTCVDATALGVSYCTKSCSADNDCGSNAFCADSLCVPYTCACTADDATNELLNAALSQAGKNACDVGQKFGALSRLYPDDLAHDALRPTIHQRLVHAPSAIPHEGKRIVERARSARANRPVSGVVRLGAELWDEGAPAEVGEVPEASDFEAAMTALGANAGETASDAADLPPALKKELARILAAVKVAIDLRNEAIPEGTDLARWFRAPMGMFQQMRETVSRADKIDFARAADKKMILDGFRYDLIARAAIVVSEAVEKSRLRVDAATYTGTFAFNQKTPFGRVIIGDGSDTTYAGNDPALEGDLLLVVDTGGNDRYEIPVGGTQSPSNPVALAIDLGGNDTYTYVKREGVAGDGRERPMSDAAGRRPDLPRWSLSEVRRQGSASLGVGMLFDFGSGNDAYESLRFSQGAGVLGVGVLYDEAGNDTYRMETVGQGGAHFGMGILIDGAGDDLYHGYSVMQGATHVKGVGMLVDYEGNDTYWTSPGNSYFSVREGGHDYFYEYGINQGAAWGRRADYPMDGVQGSAHMSGGVGALLDLGGSDSYTCGAFCQGMGYWFGTGILWDDGDGNDKSYGRMFTTGAGVHMGLGIYHDGGGDDRHQVESMCEALMFGAGDDLALGWFEDLGGNDTYEACKASFGSASEKGIGVFLDHAGNDSYRAKHSSGFGWVQDPLDMRGSSRRNEMKSLGIFADGAGTDTYARRAHFTPEPIGDGKKWMHPWVERNPAEGTTSSMPASVTYASPNVCGVGIDR